MATTERDSGASAAPPPMLTVAAVARRLGVAPSTLRTWDRRYDLGPSAHTAGSHRRYSAEDLARLVLMRRLTLEGVPPADAARIVLASTPGTSSAAGGTGEAGHARQGTREPDDEAADDDEDPADVGAPSSLGDVLRSLAIPAARAGPAIEVGTGLPADSTHRPGLSSGWPFRAPDTPSSGAVGAAARPAARAGGGRVVALPDGSPAARGLARAAMSLDSAEVHRIFGDAVRNYGVREAWDGLAMPVLQSIGERWRVTGDGVDVEHAFSEALMTVLHAVTAGARRPRNSRPVVLTCAEGDYHTLPLHALAAALAQEQVGIRVLGVGMPASALVAAVRRSGPAAVFVYARLPVTDVEVLALLPRQRPAPRLILGGPGWSDQVLPAHTAVATSLDEAVQTVLQTLGL